ncbi:MAG: hypothetical protein LIP04_08090 [Tannerellaceae bacterium]|nr:hypothetical protein [Tannerellaceae bacterium]
MIAIEGLKARMEELIGQLTFHSRYFEILLSEEWMTEAELLEAIDAMLDEYIELRNRINQLQS